MKMLLNGQEVTVFDVIIGPRAQVTTNYVQLNLGTVAPTVAVTVPVWFWNNKRGTPTTGGMRVGFVEGGLI